MTTRPSVLASRTIEPSPIHDDDDADAYTHTPFADAPYATVLSSLHLVNLLRAYTLSGDSTLSLPPPWSLTFKDESSDMVAAFDSTNAPSPQDECRIWSSLRKINKKFSRMEQSLNAALRVARYPNEDARETLINILNMISWYSFDSTLKASTSISTTAPASAASTSHENTWRLKTEVSKLFNKALEEFGETWQLNFVNKDDDDYQCNNYPDIKRPKDVGEKIKKRLLDQNSDMIEGEPRVYGVGFVTLKLSGNWMAENIRNMLRDGIDTWAPSQQFGVKSTIINSPSWDDTNLLPMDVMRRQLIIMSRMHMLEYVKSVATTSSGNGMSLPPKEFEDHFRTVEEDGEMFIYSRDVGNMKHLIRGKIRNSLGKKDGCLGYPLEDLAALWRGFVKEDADWIVCVTPSQQQDYIQSCLDAARHAGWRTTDSVCRLATYVGFRTCTTSLEDLLTFLYKAKYPCEAGEAAKVLGYTDQAVLDCALTYTFLKNHRLADCTFSYDEMLDVKGDTFVHLITTQAQIRKITDDSLKEIDALKKGSNLGLEEDKLIWSQGVERELGLHLLMFTELTNESYVSFLPHILCRYLYNLSEKFSRFYKTYAASGFEAKTRLLLCEAAAVVMEKGFHLLGITKKPSLQAVSAAMALNYVAPLEVRGPLVSVNIRTRFEMFTTYLYITKDHGFSDGELFGGIEISDEYGLVPDGWGELLNPGHGRVSLLVHDTRHPVAIKNNGRLDIGNPTSRHSVPISSFMRMNIFLFATKRDVEFFEVCNYKARLDFRPFLQDNKSSGCRFLVAPGNDGYIRMHYILLKDAVDATITIKFGRSLNAKVRGIIYAHYGSEFDFESENKFEQSLYRAVLFESFDGSEAIKDGEIVLRRSTLAVPNNVSLVIVADIRFGSRNEVIRGSCVVSAGSVDISKKIEGLEVKVAWR